MIADWTAKVPAIAVLERSALEDLQRLSHEMAMPAGTRIFNEDSLCQAYLIVLAGSVRVQKLAANGREILLYRLGAGETCIVTTACLMTGANYDAEGIAETDVTARVLPMAGFRQLLAQSAGFREFVFQAFGTRIADLLVLIEEVAFGRIDQRLAACLLDHGARELTATHQELAVELGTAREVVSRQLKEFERLGWVELGRGRLAITNRAALDRLAHKSV